MKKTALEMCREIVDKQNAGTVPIFPDVPPTILPVDNKHIEYTESGPRMRLDVDPPKRGKWNPG